MVILFDLILLLLLGGANMQINGEVVKHKVFGRGQIVEFADNYVTVLFDESKTEKKFAYPSAFGAFLEMENEFFLKQIEEDKNVIAKEEAENKRVNEELAKIATAIKSKGNGKRHLKNTTEKTSDRNNIAFKCNFCDGGNSKEIIGYKGVCSDDTIQYNINVAKHISCSQPKNMCNKYLQGEVSREEICRFYETTKSEFSKSVCYESQMLEIWIAGAGITQNGDEKGKSISIRSARANSLALLTTKLPHAKDKDRFIFAVFLIDENYEGGNKDEGYVGANPKYRLQLPLDEARKLKFWDYYFNLNKPEKIIFGSGLHRYLTDVQAVQVLKKICEIKKGTSEEVLSKEFLEYYCKIKKMDIDNIPMPEGVLKRIV